MEEILAIFPNWRSEIEGLVRCDVPFQAGRRQISNRVARESLTSNYMSICSAQSNLVTNFHFHIPCLIVILHEKNP